MKKILNLILVAALVLAVLPALVVVPIATSKWIAEATSGIKQPIVGGVLDNLQVNSAVTEYNCLMGGTSWTATENLVYQCIPTAGKIRGLYVELNGDPTAGGSYYDFWLVVDGVASTLTCRISAGSTTGSDVVHEVSVTAGQTVSISCNPSVTDPTARIARWTVEFESNTVGESICLSHRKAEMYSTKYSVLQGYGVNDRGNENDVNYPMPTAGTFKKLYVKLSADPGTNPDAYSIALRVAGATVNNSVTIVANDVAGNSGASTDIVVAGDLVDFVNNPISTPSVSPEMAIGIVFVSNTDGESLLFGGDIRTEPNTGVASYRCLGETAIGYDTGLSWSTTEIFSLIGNCTVKKLYVQLATAPGAGRSYDISINKDGGAASGLTVHIHDSDRTGNDLLNSYVATSGDTISLKEVPIGTPATTRIHTSMVLYMAPPVSNVYLTTSSGSGGNVSTPGEGTYAYNVSELVSIIGTADACYHFVNWIGSTANITNVNAASTTINMSTSNQTATANFVINTSTITYTNGSNGTINNSTPQTINCGTNTTYVLATPNACYKFVNWNDSSTMNPRTDLGTSTNYSYLANFAINTSTITYIAGANGTLNNSTPQTINCGTYTTYVLASPNASCAFVNWSDSSTTNPRRDLGTSTNQSFTANFRSLVLSISNTPDSKSFGFMLESTSYWSNGSAPIFALNDSQCFFAVTNNGDIASITINATNFTGGVGWALNLTVDVNKVVMKAGKSGDANEGAMVTLNSSPQAFITSLAASATKKWEIKLATGTFTDGVPKSSTITLVATLD